MAVIHAKGKTDEFGQAEVIITGTPDRIESIKGKTEKIALIVKWRINHRRGILANDYAPPANTMLQAYATCLTLWKEKDIEIIGSIGTIKNKKGVVY